MVERNASVFEVSTGRLLRNLAVGVAVCLTPLVNVVNGAAVSWPAVGAGVAVTGVAAGLVATSVGRRLDEWGDRTGLPERAPLVGVFALAVVAWVVVRQLGILLDALNSFLLGNAGALLAIQVGRVLLRVADGRPSAAA